MVKQGKVGSLYESQQSYITEEIQATQVHTSRCHTLCYYSQFPSNKTKQLKSKLEQLPPPVVTTTNILQKFVLRVQTTKIVLKNCKS